MNRCVLALAGVFCVGCSLLFLLPTTAAEQKKVQPAVKWEYKVISERDLLKKIDDKRLLSEQLSEAMNALGKEGWELVTAGGSPRLSSENYYFKRPKAD